MLNGDQGAPRWRIRKGAGSRLISAGLQSRRGSALEWVSGEQVRIPEEQAREFPRGLPFRAAGRVYAGTALLAAGKPPADGWATDCYGRRVYCYREPFPCFDSYDCLGETRCYRWFFICQDGRLTRVYMEDGRPDIYVTEDAAYLEEMFWEKLEKSGYYDQ